MVGEYTFTYIAATVTFLSFVLQICGAFSKHAEIRKSVFLLVLGIFIGNLITSISGSKIVYGLSFPFIGILMFFILFCIIGFLIYAVQVDDIEKRKEIYKQCGFGVFILIITLIGYGIYHLPACNPDIEKQRLTLSEFNSLAAIAIEKGDYERAITHLETIEGRLMANDPRKDEITNRIKEIKILQLK